jgi:hypothetical protein
VTGVQTCALPICILYLLPVYLYNTFFQVPLLKSCRFRP